MQDLYQPDENKRDWHKRSFYIMFVLAVLATVFIFINTFTSMVLYVSILPFVIVHELTRDDSEDYRI